MARLLAVNGLSVGDEATDLIEPNSGNVRGHYELRDAVVLNARLLNELGSLWDLPPALREVELRCDGLRATANPFVDEMLTRLGQEGVPLIKDPRISLLLPVWLQCAPAATVVICLRNPVAVARSLQRRDGSSMAFGLALWELYAAAIIRWAPLDALILDVDSVRDNPSSRATFVKELWQRVGRDPGTFVDAFEPELLQPVEARWRELSAPQQLDLYDHLLSPQPFRDRSTVDTETAATIVQSDRGHIDPVVRQGW